MYTMGPQRPGLPGDEGRRHPRRGRRLARDARAGLRGGLRDRLPLAGGHPANDDGYPSPQQPYFSVPRCAPVDPAVPRPGDPCAAAPSHSCSAGLNPVDPRGGSGVGPGVVRPPRGARWPAGEARVFVAPPACGSMSVPAAVSRANLYLPVAAQTRARRKADLAMAPAAAPVAAFAAPTARGDGPWLRPGVAGPCPSPPSRTRHRRPVVRLADPDPRPGPGPYLLGPGEPGIKEKKARRWRRPSSTPRPSKAASPPSSRSSAQHSLNHRRRRCPLSRKGQPPPVTALAKTGEQARAPLRRQMPASAAPSLPELRGSA